MTTKLLVSFLLLFTLNTHAQKYVKMYKRLSNISGKLIIDGNILREKLNTSEEIVIVGDNMIINGQSSIILRDVIIQLSGEIIIEDEVKVYPKFINSYIFCKHSGAWESKYIITKSNVKNVELDKVKHIKKLKGNPKFYLYDTTGRNVFEGTKEQAKQKIVPIGHYDLRIKGQAYQSDLLFY